jgi:hypothetical protein
MTTKKYPNNSVAPDGSPYGVLTDGAGNLVVTTTSSTGNPKKYNNSIFAPDGSQYLTLTDGNGNLV